MRKHLSLMLLLLLLITCTACGQRQTVQRMAADRITQAESVAQLQEVSDLIVVFTPERQENILSYFSDGNVSGGYTRTTGTVSQVLKGEPLTASDSADAWEVYVIEGDDLHDYQDWYQQITALYPELF